MKRILLFALLIIISHYSFSQNGGVSNIAGISYIFSDNYDQYIVSDDYNDLFIDGWTVYGVNQVQLVVNGSLAGFGTFNGCCAWSKVVDFEPGQNELYLNLHCSSDCSPPNSVSNTEYFTYVKPFEGGGHDFYVDLNYQNNNDVEINWVNNYNPRNVVFYYRVTRSETPNPAEGICINSWSADKSYIDTSVKNPGTTYYYWVEAAAYSYGSKPSGIIDVEYSSVTIPVELNATPYSISFTSSGGSQNVNVSSNIDWNVTSSDGWISISQSSGTGDATINVSVTNTEENRSGIISFSGSGATYIVTINQTGNPPTIINKLPVDDAFDVNIDNNLSITFNETVSAISGKYINIYSSSGTLHSQIETTDSQVVITNELVTIDPEVDFVGGTDYYILIDHGAFIDNSSNEFAGINNSTTWNFTILPLPDAPVNVTATALSTSEIELTWDSVLEADTYQVLSCNESVIYTTGLLATTFVVTGLTPNTTYNFVVKSENEQGASDASNCISINTLQPVPDIPVNIFATSISASEIELNWDVAANADSYTILSCDETIIYATSILQNTYVVDGLVSNSSYDFIVKSENTQGVSDASNCVSENTLCTHSWGVPVSYNYGTVASGIVTIDGEYATEEDFVGAFINNELRAVDNVTMFDDVSYISFNILGDVVETVSFLIWDQSECKEVPVSFTTSTNPNGSIGTPPNYLPIDGVTFSGIELSLTAFLEGPFNGSAMNTNLNPDNIPLTQPYNISPWNYAGTESIVSIPNVEIVDWVLVELRDAQSAILANSATIIDQQAAFLLSDGSVVGIDGSSGLQFDIVISQQLFTVIHHRNHLSIMSSSPLTEINNIYTYDFSTNSYQAYGDTYSQIEIATGIWGMVSSDANGDGQIENRDKDDFWFVQEGSTGYLEGDFDLNGAVNSLDKDKWSPNAGKSSQVPE